MIFDSFSKSALSLVHRAAAIAVRKGKLFSAIILATGCNSLEPHYRQISRENYKPTSGDIPILSKYPAGGGLVLVGEIDVASTMSSRTFIRQLKDIARRKGADAIVVRGESSHLQNRNVIVPSYVTTIPTTTTIQGSSSTFLNHGRSAQTTFGGVVNSSQAVVIPGTSGTITETVTEFTADFIRYDSSKKIDPSTLSKLPYGKLTERTGFVRSPYADSIVCVSAISRGDATVCPVTGKSFRVP